MTHSFQDTQTQQAVSFVGPAIRGSGFGSKDNTRSTLEGASSSYSDPSHGRREIHSMWQIALTMVLGCIIMYASYRTISDGIAWVEHGRHGYSSHPNGKTSRTGHSFDKIDPALAKKMADAVQKLPPHAPGPPRRGTEALALSTGFSLAVDLLAVFMLVWLWRKKEVVYEGRVHGGGRMFTLAPTGEPGELPQPLEVRVRSDWAQDYIHDGDRLQVNGKWKKQIWKKRMWIDAKRIYNFTTGANWDRASSRQNKNSKDSSRR